MIQHRIVVALFILVVIAFIATVFKAGEYKDEMIIHTVRIVELKEENVVLKELLHRVRKETFLIDEMLDRQRNLILKVLQLKEGEEEIERQKDSDNRIDGISGQDAEAAR